MVATGFKRLRNTLHIMAPTPLDLNTPTIKKKTNTFPNLLAISFGKTLYFKLFSFSVNKCWQTVPSLSLYCSLSFSFIDPLNRQIPTL